jgi:AraC-like DNA-binding protein
MDPWVYYWIGFDGIDVTQLMQLCNITMNKPILHYDNMQEITDLIAPLVTLSSGILSESYVALSQFYLICSKLMQNNHNIKPLSRKEYYVNQAVSQIQNSYYKDITVQSIADSIGLDRTYLYRIFKEISGIPMQQYIANLRLKRACYFLTDTTMSYNEISYYCGYSSEQYFSMVFKKNMSMTPSAYRKNPPHK